MMPAKTFPLAGEVVGGSSYKHRIAMLAILLLCPAMILLCSAKRADNGEEQDSVAPDAD